MTTKFTRSQIVPLIITLGLAIFAAVVMLKGSGFFLAPTFSEILLTVLMILVLSHSKLTFYGLLLPITIAYMFYTPVGIVFGSPTYQYIASLFATDLLESREFLGQLPFYTYALSIGLLLAVILIFWLTRKYHIRFLNNRTFVIGALFASFCALAPLKFFNVLYGESVKVKRELETLNSHNAIPSEWGQSTLVDSKYDDYVLVVGESARKDYHNAYGYPADNTPFMSSAKGTLIDGFTAGGTNTIASLKLMLTKPNTQTWEGNYRLSLVDLIRSAGIKTYWISNQGYLGRFDTPISSIANRSDEKIFLKKGDSLNTNTSDFDLLPKFSQVIEQPATGKRFIVVHLYGSHPITCDRLTDFPKLYDDSKIDKKYFNVNCYASSMKKTDEVLKRLYEQLMKNQAEHQRSFSMVYFSDHGLSHEITKDNIVIHNSSGQSKLHFDVPLFKISSDDTERHVYKVFKSGLNFTDGIAKWVGISNPKLNAEVDLFSNQSDKNDYGLKQKIESITAPLDPAIVIPTK